MYSTFQILFYALRPGIVRAQKLTVWHAVNVAFQLLSDAALVHLAGWRPLIYLIMSSFFAGSLHPCAGHFIAEHYLWDGLDQETYSYYGPLNIVAYNVSTISHLRTYLNPILRQVGYHNEHHDFPSIPWTRLPSLKALAPEFYDTIPSHPSWPMVIFNFIRDKEVGMFARLKRKGKDTSNLSIASTAHKVACTADVSNGSDSDGGDSDGKKSD
jgi:sphingolipid 4-desaturase/C4-monooxygenase